MAHFRRPDCTASGDGEFIIHKPSEKDLIPTVLHHYPICVTYALYDGKIPIADPTDLEERVTNASIVLAINSYKELCSMHLTGIALTSPFLIQNCSEIAAERARHTVEFIKDSLEQDRIDREKGEIKGFSQSIKLTSIPSNYTAEQKIDASMDDDDDNEVPEDDEEMPTAIGQQNKDFTKVDVNTIATKWKNDKEKEQQTHSDQEESSEDDEEKVPENKSKSNPKNEVVIELDSDEDDEEKETIIII